MRRLKDGGMPRWASHSIAVVAVSLVLLSTHSVARCQENPGIPLSGQSPSGQDAPIPQLTVRAKAELGRRVGTFVNQVSGSGGHNDEPAALWRGPICLLVAGLPHDDGQRVFDRLFHTLSSVGVAMGSAGCRPNFFFIVSAQPDALLNEAWHKNYSLFGNQPGVRAFIDSARPVRVWYNAGLIGNDGSTSSVVIASLSGFEGVPTYKIAPSGLSEFGLNRQIETVIAVIDIRQVMGLDWRQIADFVAMSGLTEIRPDTDFGDAPTILRLFSASGEHRLMSLSPWDKALLQELYRTDQGSKNQRQDVARGMLRDLYADRGN